MIKISIAVEKSFLEFAIYFYAKLISKRAVLSSDTPVCKQILVTLIDSYHSTEHLLIYLKVSHNGSIGYLSQTNDENIMNSTSSHR